MSGAIADMRISYERDSLNRDELADDPFEMFRGWFEVAKAEMLEPNAMTLATASADGIPAARMVLLKGIDDRGFRFYSNYESDKGQNLAENPHAALVFYWDALHRSVRIVGEVEQMTPEESIGYYHSRPRGSQIGAWASPQSTVLPNREALEEKWQGMEQKFADSAEIPLPPYWGGYRVVPRTIEFWQGRKSRLHDRFRYTRQPNGGWQIDRLAP